MGQLCSTNSKTLAKTTVAFAQEYKGVLFESINGDIIETEAEAIINAANPQLLHNNSLSNNLLAKGGQIIQGESNKISQEFEGGIPVGHAVVTSAGKLKAKYIIHVITPVWNGGSSDEEAKLGECVSNALAQAEKHKLKSIAVPALDGGASGFPKETAARILVQQCVLYIDAHQPTSIQNIKFINTNAATVSAFKTTIEASLVNLARENPETREDISTTQGESVVCGAKPVGHSVEQRPEAVVETVSEEKKEEVPAVIEQVAVEKVVEEKQQETPVVVEEQKPEEVVEQPAIEEKQQEATAVVEEKQEEAVVEQVIEEQKPVEQVPEQVAEEQKPEEVVEHAPAVEEEQEEVSAVVEQVVEEEKPVEEQSAVVEEQKPEEVAAEAKPEETQETKETEAQEGKSE